MYTEPTEAECFEAEQELLFDVRFRQMDREIRKMMEEDKKNTEQDNQPDNSCEHSFSPVYQCVHCGEIGDSIV